MFFVRAFHVFFDTLCSRLTILELVKAIRRKSRSSGRAAVEWFGKTQLPLRPVPLRVVRATHSDLDLEVLGLASWSRPRVVLPSHQLSLINVSAPTLPQTVFRLNKLHPFVPNHAGFPLVVEGSYGPCFILPFLRRYMCPPLLYHTAPTHTLITMEIALTIATRVDN